MCEARRPVRAISSSGRAFYPESTSAETDARSGGTSRVARPGRCAPERGPGLAELTGRQEASHVFALGRWAARQAPSPYEKTQGNTSPLSPQQCEM